MKAVRSQVAVIHALLGERDRRYEERFNAQERANTIALSAANERLARMNEFRDQLTDQAGTFVTREELNARLEAINGTLTRLDSHDAANRGRGLGMTQLWAIIVGIAGLLFGGVMAANSLLGAHG